MIVAGEFFSILKDIVSIFWSSFFDSLKELLSDPNDLAALTFVLAVVVAVTIFSNHSKKKKEAEYQKQLQLHRNSTYYKITGKELYDVYDDLGAAGEYDIFKRLQHYENNDGKFLFNIYIPRESGETTEIDVLLITHRGIFVFESKNFSGWVFGDERQKMWTQSFAQYNGGTYKERFYNPIMQNKAHIRNLQKLLGDRFPFFSVIVFSERCELKNIVVKSADVHVINAYDIHSVVYNIYHSSENDVLTIEDISSIYDLLYPYTQVDLNTKEQHINSINNYGIQNDSNIYIPEKVETVDDDAGYSETRYISFDEILDEEERKEKESTFDQSE